MKPHSLGWPAVTLLALVAAATPTLGACDLINTPTKTASGELYQSGDPRYDSYFSTVHQQQLEAANWPDESKTARKPIITALSLRVGSSNPTIMAATRDKKGDASIGHAVDETVTAERDFAHRLTAAGDKLDDLLKRGEDLKKQAADDRRNMAAEKADEKKKAKKDEVRHELSAAVDAVDSMTTDARKGAKEANELATKLRGAWTGREDDEAPPKEEKKDDKPDPKPEAKPEKKKPDAPAAKKPRAPADTAPAPAPKKPPAEKSPDEVFNP